MEPTTPINADDEDNLSTLLTGKDTSSQGIASPAETAGQSETTETEYKSAKPPKFYADLIFDSYRMSQGSISFQHLLLQAVLSLHPELQPVDEDYEVIKEATVRRIAKWMRVDAESAEVDIPYHVNGFDTGGLSPLDRIEKSVIEDALPAIFPSDDYVLADRRGNAIIPGLNPSSELSDEIFCEFVRRDYHYLTGDGRPHEDDDIRHKGKFLGSRVSYLARFILEGESTESDEFDEVLNIVRLGVEDYVKGTRTLKVNEADGDEPPIMLQIIHVLRAYIASHPEDLNKLPDWVRGYAHSDTPGLP